MAGEGGTAARPRVLSRKILHVRSSRSVAGPEHHLLELLPGLGAHGIAAEVALLYRRRPGESAEHPLLGMLAEVGIPAFQVADSGRLGLAARRVLADRLRRGDLVALHGHDPKSDWVISRVVGEPGLETTFHQVVRRFATLHLHTCTTLPLRLYRRIDLRLLRRFDGGIAVSAALAAELAAGSPRRGGGPWRVIPNGVDGPRLRARAAAALPAVRAELAALGADGGGPVLVAAGRLTHQKGLDLLLDALPAVVARHPRLLLLIAGAGPEGAALERQVERLELGNRVRFLGERRDVEGLLAAADGVVLPSRREGSPYLLLEAMALAVPIVAAAVGGVGEMLGEGRDGLLVPAGDREALAARIATLLEDPGAARRRAERAREAVAGRLAAARMTAETAAFYAEALA